MQWDDLRYFLAVERCRTLSAAAQRLGVDATTVGRRVDRLSLALNATLFDVGANGHTLTTVGEHLLRYAEEVERAILSASGSLTGERARLAGTVRISLSEGFATAVVAKHLPSFHARHPDITLEIATTNGFFNPSKREADLAVMLARPSRGPLVSRKLADYRLGLFASRTYLDTHGAPTSIGDLHQRPIIGYVPDLIYSDELRYLREIDVDLTADFTSSSINIQHAMTRAGLGIAVLPCFMGLQDNSLTPVLVDDVSITRSLWVVVHQDLRRIARIAAVIEWLVETVEANVNTLRGLST